MNKIIFENHEDNGLIRSVSIEYHWDAGINDMVEIINLLLIGIGFHPETIKEILVQEDE